MTETATATPTPTRSPAPRRPQRPATAALVLALAVFASAFGLAFAPSPAAAQQVGAAAVGALAQDDAGARQVTLFGVLATPGDASLDPKLAAVAAQLRKLLPNHGFRLLGVQSRRLTVNQTLSCPLGDGFVAEATLLDPLDANGKVQLRCAVALRQVPQLGTLVGTPPNQLFFCEKLLPNGQRLLVGVGAR